MSQKRTGRSVITNSHHAKNRVSKISIIGMGYVGLATSVCLATRGYRVYGVEIDKKKCDLIRTGKSPIHEKGLDSYLKECVTAGNLTCTTGIRESVVNSEITFITVGTPSKPDGDIDLTYVKAAAREVGKVLAEKDDYHLVVVKSTVTPGTTVGIVKQTLEEASGKDFPRDFGLCFNPEFLREGSAIQDTMESDVLVIGAQDERSSETLLSLYKSFYGDKNFPYALITKIPNAEFVKYSVNTFRATQLSFLNSLANLCEKIPSADISDVIKGLSSVTKIDNRYLRPGLGYGGSCLPKDLRALTALYRKMGVNDSMLVSAAEVNEEQPLRAVELTKELLGEISGNKIAVLGLTFKGGTDDIRESVAIRVVSSLAKLGAKVRAYDPEGMENAKSLLVSSSVEFASNVSSCLKNARCCIICTDWSEFRKIPASLFRSEMQSPIVIDGCRVLDVDACRGAGVFVYQIGRNSSDAPIRQEINARSANHRKVAA